MDFDFVSIREASQRINISEALIRNLIRDGRLKYIRPTERKTRVDLQALREMFGSAKPEQRCEAE